MELNHRVIYPVKGDQQGAVNMDDETTKFCVSYILQVCSVGMIQMIEAWNNHIACKEIPNSLHASNCHINQIHTLEELIGNDSIVDKEVPSLTHMILGRIL